PLRFAPTVGYCFPAREAAVRRRQVASLPGACRRPSFSELPCPPNLPHSEEDALRSRSKTSLLFWRDCGSASPVSCHLQEAENGRSEATMADGDWARYRQLRGKALPPVFEFRGCAYAQEQLFKRDFYAATGLYRRERTQTCAATLPDCVILKIYHTDPFWFLPLDWLGRWLCQREAGFLEALDGITGIPRLLGRHGDSGLVREFIPGCNL